MQERDAREAQLFERADELMTAAPGVVTVKRISQIADVRTLRTAREALTDAEQQRLRSLRLELMERLDGAVDARASVASTIAGPTEPTGFVDRIFALLRRGSTAMRTQGQIVSSAEHDDSPQRLPAPTELLDAAEAWLISHWVADRSGSDGLDDPEALARLRSPWEQAQLVAE